MLINKASEWSFLGKSFLPLYVIIYLGYGLIYQVNLYNIFQVYCIPVQMFLAHHVCYIEQCLLHPNIRCVDDDYFST